MLIRLRHSDLYEKMVQEYISLKRIEEGGARELIEKQFNELDSFINAEYEVDIGRIDKQINRYYNLYATRMSMVLSSRTNLEQTIEALLTELKKKEQDARETALMRLGEAFRLQSYGYVGKKSLARRKKRQPNVKSAALSAISISEEELSRLTDELMSETPDRYNPDRVEAYFAAKQIPAQYVPIESCGLHTRDDVMMAAASIIYSGTAGFSYEVSFREGLVDTETAVISRFLIRKRKESA